jgi:hypothetical protein
MGLGARVEASNDHLTTARGFAPRDPVLRTGPLPLPRDDAVKAHDGRMRINS